jgi:hypothetical protein
VSLVDGTHSFRDARQHHGFDLGYEKHGNWNAVERILREIKR